jgi:hypothetical protein
MIRRRFLVRLYVGRLPDTITIGYVARDNTSMLYSGHRFLIYRNNNHIVEVQIYPEKPVPLKENSSVRFNYSVEWKTTTRRYRDRFQKFCDVSFCKHPIRDYAVVNSLVLALLLILLTAFVITKFLGTDLRRFEREAEIGDMEFERVDRGWRSVHADVFRVPSNPGLISLLCGIGAQLCFSVLVFMVFNALLRLFWRYHSASIVGFIVVTFSGPLGGYFSSGFYRRWNGISWIAHTFVTSIAIPLTYFLYHVLFALLSRVFGADPPIHFSMCLAGTSLVIFLGIPLTFVGAIIGRHWFFFGQEAPGVGLVKRPIPPTPLHLRIFPLALAIGVCF